MNSLKVMNLVSGITGRRSTYLCEVDDVDEYTIVRHKRLPTIAVITLPATSQHQPNYTCLIDRSNRIPLKVLVIFTPNRIH